MLKKTVTAVLLAITMCFTACVNESKYTDTLSSPQNTDIIQQDAAPAHTPAVTPTLQPLPSGRVLTDKELETANREINKDSVFNAVLCSMTVQTPTQKTGIDGTLFIRLAELDEFRNNKLTVYNEYELKTLKEEGLNLEYDDIETDAVDYYRIPYSVVKQRIEKYLGVTYEGSIYQYDTKKCDYSPIYDCIYINPKAHHYHNTFNYIYGIETQTHVYLYSAVSELVLEKRRSGYIIKAYRRHNCRLPVTPAVQQENKDYAYMPKKVFLYADNTKSAEYNRAIKVYNKYLSDNFSDYDKRNTVDSCGKASYGLLDMTKDGIPELVVQKHTPYPVYNIFTRTDGQLKELGSYGTTGDGFSTMLSNGKAVYRHAGWGRLQYWFSSYDENSVEYVNNFEVWYYPEPRGYEYFINGKQVSRNEYIVYTRYLLEQYKKLKWYPEYETFEKTEAEA